MVANDTLNHKCIPVLYARQKKDDRQICNEMKLCTDILNANNGMYK